MHTAGRGKIYERVAVKKNGVTLKVFKCKFGKDVTCEIQVADAPPPKGSQHIHKVEWSGKPSVKVIRPYIAWMNSVNKLLADEWGVKLMHIFQTKPSWAEAEIWVYEPHKQPKRAALYGKNNNRNH